MYFRLYKGGGYMITIPTIPTLKDWSFKTSDNEFITTKSVVEIIYKMGKDPITLEASADFHVAGKLYREGLEFDHADDQRSSGIIRIAQVGPGALKILTKTYGEYIVNLSDINKRYADVLSKIDLSDEESKSSEESLPNDILD